MYEVTMNGIIEIKRKVAEAINMDVMYVTDCYIEHDEVVFTVLLNDRFVASYKDGYVDPTTVQHLKTLDPIEDIPF